MENQSGNHFSRSRNVGRNMIFGYINRCFSLLLPFIVRTVVIYRFGALYLGMNSLLSSIFQMLNLAELGFGAAVVYSLYRPVAEEDTDTVCAYLGTYRQIYRVIGLVILTAGLAVMPFFPNLLRGQTVPFGMDIFIWYLIFLADTVISYLLFGYKTAIPSALQRNDLLSRVDTAVLIGKSIVQVSFLLLTDNFYFYLLTSLCFTVLRNFLISHLVERYYPQYVCRGRIDAAQFRELKRLVGGLALSKFRGASRHMIDSLCITVFVSLAMTAVYSNYFLVLTSVTSLFGIIGSSMVASVGNSIVTENEEKNYRDMRRFNFMYMLLAGWAVICMLCLYQPFVRLWVGPDLMLGMPEVVALCLYFYVLKMGDLRWIYFEGAGLWWKARYIVIAEIIANIVLNLLLAKYWGVLGIILATLISLFFINFIGEAWILFKEYFKNGRLSTFFADQALYFGVTVVLAVACLAACNRVGLPCIEVGHDALQAATGAAKVAGVNAVNGASASATGGTAALVATGIVNGVANPGQSKLFALAGLAARLLLCTLIVVAGYYLSYRWTERYREAKEWLWSRFKAVKR